MRVILKKAIKGLGNEGDVVEVNDGYGRNFLLPRGLAVEASASNLALLKQRQEKEKREAMKALQEAQHAAALLNGKSVRITARAGEGGRLFGSITSQDIADAIKNTFKITVDKKRIGLETPIKSAGRYRVNLKLHQQVSASLEVEVIPQ